MHNIDTINQLNNDKQDSEQSWNSKELYESESIPNILNPDDLTQPLKSKKRRNSHGSTEIVNIKYRNNMTGNPIDKIAPIINGNVTQIEKDISIKDRLMVKKGNKSSSYDDKISKISNNVDAGVDDSIINKSNLNLYSTSEVKFINCDDEAGVQNMNKRLFKKQEVNLEICFCGDELMVLIGDLISNNIQIKKVVIVMDYNLEKEFGDEVIKKLRD